MDKYRQVRTVGITKNRENVIKTSTHLFFRAFFTPAYARRTWMEDMLKEKKKGGDPSKALRYKVAQMLNKVGGGGDNNSHRHLKFRSKHKLG